MNNVITLIDIKKSFIQGNVKLDIFDSVNLEIKQGEIVALVGSSGCGKTTFLQIAGLLDDADFGKTIINNIEIDYLKSKISDKIKTELRKKYIGFIYQSHNLFKEFTALENVIMPELIKNINAKLAKTKAIDILTKLGLAERLNHFPAELSGGEQQRVAIARALIGNPSLILADEPTGNLDPNSAELVMNYFINIVKDLNLAALIVTHNIELAKKADRILTFRNNNIQSY